MKYLYRHIRIIDPLSQSDYIGDLAIADNKIVDPAEFTADIEFNGEGWCVCPGLIDLSARLQPIDSERQAALAAGIVYLVSPPDMAPPLDEPGLVERFIQRSNLAGMPTIAPLGALTKGLQGSNLSELCALKAAGCIGFAENMADFSNLMTLKQLMEYAATYQYTLYIKPQNKYLQTGCAHDGEIAARLGLASIPASAETIALATLIILARETGVRLHVLHLSSASGVAMLEAAIDEGLPISGDVSIYHLHLTDAAIGFFDSMARFNPPLRSEQDRLALRHSLARGYLALCSDHIFCTQDEKLLPFAEAKPGASALELLLPLTLAWAKVDDVPLTKALARLTIDPARIIGLPPPSLAVGQPATMTLFDPEAEWLVDAQNLLSTGKNTPWLGRPLTGKVVHVHIEGKLAYVSD